MTTPGARLGEHESAVEPAQVAYFTRSQLCAIAESGETQSRHLAALLAFTPSAEQSGGRMRLTFEHVPTALWIQKTLDHPNVAVTGIGGRAGIIITDPNITLAQYGFHEDRWVFGRGLDASLGVSRGAIHAAAEFTRQGMKVPCPNSPLMLTLTVMMARLGITARPAADKTRIALSSGDLDLALEILNIPAVSKAYAQLRSDRAPRCRP